jgi:lipid-A-disaccharide synthase
LLNSLNPKRILIISGEVSGDQHGAKLVSEALKIDPSLRFLGMGGEKMRQAGVDIIVDNKAMAVVGATEVLSHALPIFRAWQTLRKIIKRRLPDLVILIDYPGFNLQIARIAKKAGIKVLYYIGPQVWAWKQHRVHTIKQRVDKMLVVFPFEAALYERAGVPVEFVGHPLAGSVHPNMSKEQARAHFKIDAHAQIIGLLPGSRKGEISRLLPTILQAAQRLKTQYPDMVFILPLAASLTQADIAPYLPAIDLLPLYIIRGHFYDALQLCDAAIVTSGTATLETALLGIPMVIVYKTTALTYFLAKRIIKIPYIGLCNIVAQRLIVKELIQHEANPVNISDEISHILNDRLYRENMQHELLKLKEKLGKGGGSTQAAKAVIALCGA